MTTMPTKHFRVFRGPRAALDAIGPSLLALGGFDGVHAGHLALLERARVEARVRGLPVGAATFDDRRPAPRAGHKHVPALTGLADRLRLLREAGMDFVVLTRGEPAALGVADDVFTSRLDVMKSRLVVLRGGEQTAAAGELQVEAITGAGVAPNSWVSTTRVRERLRRGEIEAVNDLLGRRYEVTATVRETGRGWLWAGVPVARALPAPGDYRVVVGFRSGASPALVESVATVEAVDAGAADLILPLDRPVDHGRLRVGFLSRCIAGSSASTHAAPGSKLAS